MATFVIHLYRLQEDLLKLSEQLSFHESKLLASGKRIQNHNIKLLIKEVDDFYTNFNNLISEAPSPDIYDSAYVGPLAYRYAEVSYENQARIKSIRLLGPKVSTLPPFRFFASNLKNPFSITALKLISDIRELVKKNQDPSLADLFRCDEDDDFSNDMKAIHSIFTQDKKQEYKYKWQKFETYFSPEIKYVQDEKMTDEEVEKLVQEHHEKTIQSRKELEAKLQKIEKEKQRWIENRKNKTLKASNPAEELDKVIEDGKKQVENALNVQQAFENAGEDIKQASQQAAAEMEYAVEQAIRISNDMVMDWLDRHTLGCLIEEALKCVIPANVDCRDALAMLTPGEIFDRLSLVFPRGSDTFQAIEQAIESSLYEGTGILDLKTAVTGLEDSILQDEVLLSELKRTRDTSAFVDPKVTSGIANLEEKISLYNRQLEETKQQLETKLNNFASDMELTDRQATEIKNGGGNIAAILSLPQEGTQLGPTAITGKIISAIDTVVPLEDLCEAITSALSTGLFSLEFKLPEPKEIDDIFAGFAEKFSKLVGALIIQAIVSFIQSMLEDLINCDNLDNLISQMINSSMTGEEINLLNQLFGGDSAQQIIQDNYEQFVDTFARTASENIKFSFGENQASLVSEEDIKAILTPSTDFTEGVTGEKVIQEAATTLVDLAEAAGKSQAEINEQIFGSGEYIQNLFDQGKAPDGNWMIDSTGTKFEIVDGVRVVNLQEVDKYISSLSQDATEAIKQNANITRQALIDAFGQATEQEEQPETTNTSSKQFSLVLSEEDKQNIKNELVCIMKHITSLLSPSQTLSLFAGTATSEVVSLSTQIVNLCAPNLKLVFNDQNKVENMLNTFGSIAGLESMQDSVQLLAASEQFNDLALQPERCGPYDSVEDFRKDLMLSLVEPEKAEKILEEMNKERMQKFKEVGNSLIDMSKGALPEASTRSPNKLVLDAIKAVIEGREIPESPEPASKKAPATIENKIQKAIDDEFNNSPVIQNIYKKVVNSLFRPIDMSFKSDMDGFIEAFSDIVEKEEVVEREIELSAGGRKVKIINPVFKDLLDSNLIPALEHKSGPKEKKEKYAKMVDKSNFDLLEIKNPLDQEETILRVIQDRPASLGKKALYVSGEASKNYLVEGLNGVPLKPVLKKVNKKDVAASFKRNLPNIETDSVFTADRLNIYLSGTFNDIQESYMTEAQSNLDLPDELKTMLESLKQNKPSWAIGFEEFEQTGVTINKISLETLGLTPSGKRIDPFYIQGRFEIDTVPRPVKDIKRFLIEKYETDNKQRKQVFDNILFENIKDFIVDREDPNIEQYFSQSSVDIYNKFMTAFLNGSTNSILNTDLLKENQEVKSKTGQSITNIEALNFANRCKTVMQFEDLKKEFKAIYDSLEEPEVTQNQRRGLEPRPSKSKEASLLVVSKIFVRLLCFETMLKSLPAFEYYKYSTSLVENDLMTNLVCKFIESDLERIGIRNVILENIKKYYNKQIEMETGEYGVISEEEKRQHRASSATFPIELKIIVQKEFKELLDKTKEIAKVEEELGLSDANDFIRPILNTFKTCNVHQNSGIRDVQVKDTIFYSLNINEEFVLQKYIRLPSINRQSRVVRENSDFFTTEKIEQLEKNRVVSFEQAASIFGDISYNIGENYKIYDCDDSDESLYSEPYRAGLRIVYVERKTENPNQGPDPTFKIGNERYPFLFDNCEQEKLGYIVERTLDLNEQIDYNVDYNVVQVAAEEIKVNQTEDAKGYLSRDNENRYTQEFLVRLKKKLLDNIDTNLIFAYSFPLREIASMLIIHTNLANNNYKMKYFLEPTKNTMVNITNTLMKMGDKTKNPVEDMLANMFDAINNVGNPAGPLDPDALKMYIRTPIQILKSLASIVDPNIALADKINGGISLAGSLVGQKIFIPYSALSLALLPAPIFGGLIPYIPPLTSYNLAPPLGPAFLLLEPLLWDLPWFQGVAKPEEDTECEDIE